LREGGRKITKHVTEFPVYNKLTYAVKNTTVDTLQIIGYV